jgi:hypothetical protein
MRANLAARGRVKPGKIEDHLLPENLARAIQSTLPGWRVCRCSMTTELDALAARAPLQVQGSRIVFPPMVPRRSRGGATWTWRRCFTRVAGTRDLVSG